MNRSTNTIQKLHTYIVSRHAKAAGAWAAAFRATNLACTRSKVKAASGVSEWAFALALPNTKAGHTKKSVQGQAALAENDKKPPAA